MTGSITDNYDKPFLRTMVHAKKIALEYGYKSVTPEIFLLGILKSGSNVVVTMFHIINVKTDSIIAKLDAYVKSQIKPEDMTSADHPCNPEMREDTQKAIQGAFKVKNKMGDQIVGVHHMLLSLIANNKNIEQILSDENVNAKTLREAMEDLVVKPVRGSVLEKEEKKAAAPQFTPKDKEPAVVGKTKEQKMATSEVISKFCTDLTMEAATGKLDPVIGRDNEVSRLESILCRKRKNNPILVGEPGTGKSAIVDGLAQRIISGKVSPRLKDKKIIRLNLLTVVAGTQYRGQFEERMKSIMQVFKETPEYIMFIDEIHTLLGAGGATGTLDASNILKPSLARGEIRLIGATTLDEHQKTISKDGALDRRFQQVMVSENTRDETVQILTGIRSSLESFHKCKITDAAIIAAVDLADQYIPNRRMPDKAIDCLDEACASVSAKGGDLVDLDQIITAVADQAKLPKANIVVDNADRVSGITEKLKQHVFGQDHAVESIGIAINNAYSGMTDTNRPLASFVIGGPEQSGKKTLVKCLSDIVSPIKDSVIYINMADFMDKHDISRLIGSPPGYVGYGEKNMLSDRVYRRPDSIVVFHGLDKGNPEVLRIVDGILSTGELVDAEAKNVSFRNTMIFLLVGMDATRKNASSLGLLQNDGSGVQKDEYEKLRSKLIGLFEKDFGGIISSSKIDEFISLSDLSDDALISVANMEIKRLAGRIAAKRSCVMTWDEDRVGKWVLSESKKSHAANAAKVIEVIKKKIQPAVSAKIIENKPSKMHLSIRADNLYFKIS